MDALLSTFGRTGLDMERGGVSCVQLTLYASYIIIIRRMLALAQFAIMQHNQGQAGQVTKNQTYRIG